ncbi:DHA3 family macrolide efflux protein-like MFS transporter [Paenibacillus sp. PvP094]|uniref:MFS transporter n=1 Tax=Paenibacillus sp. PvP094 TaxID=3156394 RepID=UPI00339721B6
MNFKKIKIMNSIVIITNQFLTEIADTIFSVVIFLYVYEQTNSALSASLITTVTFLTHIFIGPIMGVFSDRFHPKKGMQYGYMIMIMVGLLLSLFFMYSIDYLILMIYISLLIHNVCMLFIVPAKNKLLPQIVPREELVRVNGYVSSSTNLAELIGNTISGFILALIGFVGIMLIHSGVYLLASLLLLLLFDLSKISNLKNMSKSAEVEIESKQSGFFTELIEGYVYLKSNRPLFKLVFMSTILNVTSMITPLLIVLITTQYGGGSKEYGFFNAGAIVSSFIVGLLVSYVNKLISPGKIFSITLCLAGFCLILISFFSDIYVGGTLYFIFAGLLTMQRIIFNSFFMHAVEEKVRGRVLSLSLAISVVTVPLFSLLGGYISDIVSANYVYVFSGIWLSIWSVFPLLDQDIKSIDKIM